MRKVKYFFVSKYFGNNLKFHAFPYKNEFVNISGCFALLYRKNRNYKNSFTRLHVSLQGLLRRETLFTNFSSLIFLSIFEDRNHIALIIFSALINLLLLLQISSHKIEFSKNLCKKKFQLIFQQLRNQKQFYFRNTESELIFTRVISLI